MQYVVKVGGGAPNSDLAQRCGWVCIIYTTTSTYLMADEGVKKSVECDGRGPRWACSAVRGNRTQLRGAAAPESGRSSAVGYHRTPSAIQHVHLRWKLTLGADAGRGLWIHGTLRRHRQQSCAINASRLSESNNHFAASQQVAVQVCACVDRIRLERMLLCTQLTNRLPTDT